VSRRDGGPLGDPAPDSRQPSTTNPPNQRSPSHKLGVSPCRVARTLAAGILPSARSMLARSRPPCLHSPATPAPRHGLTPHAPVCGAGPRVGKGYRHLAALGASLLFQRSPPARAGGTAGRWAIPVPGNPRNRPPPAGLVEDPDRLGSAQHGQPGHQIVTPTCCVSTVSGMPRSARVSRQAAIASRMFVIASSRDSPCDTQPGHVLAVKLQWIGGACR